MLITGFLGGFWVLPEASEGMQEQVRYVSLVLRSALAGDELQRTERSTSRRVTKERREKIKV